MRGKSCQVWVGLTTRLDLQLSSIKPQILILPNQDHRGSIEGYLQGVSYMFVLTEFDGSVPAYEVWILPARLELVHIYRLR